MLDPLNSLSINSGTPSCKKQTSHSYLGVTITDKLTWNHHIDQIISTANCYLAFIMRNMHQCPNHTKTTACKTLVRPLLEYYSSVWDPQSILLINKLEMVQRRAAHFYINAFKTKDKGCVTNMLTRLEWDTLAC